MSSERLPLPGCLTCSKVIVHKSTTAKMDFNAKNFQYVKLGFADFIEEASNGGKLYLRALSGRSPTESPANLNIDFPTIAGDFLLPAQLEVVHSSLFSSVLRISGPVNMWLHYDVRLNE